MLKSLRFRVNRTLEWGSLCSINYLQIIPQKAKIRPTQTPQKPVIGLNQVLRKGKQFLFHKWHPWSQVDADICACEENRFCLCLRLLESRTVQHCGIFTFHFTTQRHRWCNG